MAWVIKNAILFCLELGFKSRLRFFLWNLDSKFAVTFTADCLKPDPTNPRGTRTRQVRYVSDFDTQGWNNECHLLSNKIVSCLTSYARELHCLIPVPTQIAT